MNLKESRRGRIFSIFLGTLIFLYPLQFLNQGLNFTDMGFALTNYKLIFSNPVSIQYSFGYWLTNIIGGTWLNLFESWGVVGIKLANVLITYLTIFFIIRLLEKRVPINILLLSILISQMFIQNFHVETWLSYNTITTVMYVAALYFIHLGFRKSYKYLIVAGLFIGLNVFVRFPNLVGLLLILALFSDFEDQHKKGWEFIKRSSFLIAGFTLAVFLALSAMKILDHLELYINTVSQIFSVLDRDASLYSSSNLIDLYVITNIKYLLKGIALLTGLYVLLKSISGFQTEQTFISRIGKLFAASMIGSLLVAHFLFDNFIFAKIFLFRFAGLFALNTVTIIVITQTGEKAFKKLAFFAGFTGAVAFGLLVDHMHLGRMILSALYAGLSIVCIISILNKWRSFYLFAGALLILVCTPIGSNLGYIVSIHGMVTAFTLMLLFLFLSRNDQPFRFLVLFSIQIPGLTINNQNIMTLGSDIKRVVRKYHFITILQIVVAGGILVSSVKHDSTHLFREKNRTLLVHTVNHPKLCGVLTSEFRAKQLEELLNELNQITIKGEIVLGYKGIPIIHYLTDTVPYLNNSWPQLYSPSGVEEALANARRSNDNLPLIIRSKGNELPRWALENKTFPVLDKFTSSEGYTVQWSNDYFEILVPPGK